MGIEWLVFTALCCATTLGVVVVGTAGKEIILGYNTRKLEKQRSKDCREDRMLDAELESLKMLEDRDRVEFRQ